MYREHLMKLIIVRHGDPDYSIDSLTEQGWKEAESLAKRLSKLDIQEILVSPKGRAKDTASCTLKALGREGTVVPWLREFTRLFIDRPDNTEEKRICWDWLPADWTARPHFFDKDHWFEDPVFAAVDVKSEYDRMIEGLDGFLEKAGYRRNGLLYDVTRSNDDVHVFFCHFGIECVLLSHLLNVSPMPLWHGTCALPTGVTTLVTEERREGIAAFRMLQFGDLSHLYADGIEPAFAGRFRECQSHLNERRDDYLGI